MNAHLHRLGIALLLLSGVLGIVPVWQATNLAAVEVQHRDLMLGLLSASLFLSAVVPQLRLPAIAASVLSKLAFIGVAMASVSGGPAPAQVWLEVLLSAALLTAAAVFLREAWQEARWNGMLPVRLES